MSTKDFEYFRELDAFLLEQEAHNAEQKKWLEHDAQDIGSAALMLTIESPLL